MDTGGQGEMIVVVDTNVVVESLLLPNGQISNQIKANILIAPDFLLLELGNVLRKYHHFAQLDAHDVFEYIAITRDIIRYWIPDKFLLERALELSIDFNHAIYDCLFLSLAEFYEVPIWTLDEKLRLKARSLELSIMDDPGKG